MRILVSVILTMTLTGCVGGQGVSQSAVLDRLSPLVTAHAKALAGDDIAEMRRTGRVLIATYDAGVGLQ